MKDGISGLGFVWSSEGGNEEEWRQSVAPIPVEKLTKFSVNAYNDLDSSYPDTGFTSTMRESQAESENSDSNASDDGHHKDVDFEGEVFYESLSLFSFAMLCFNLEYMKFGCFPG